MEALITRFGERRSPHLVEFYDVNCPFCAKAALRTWPEVLSAGAYVELVYLPIHYSLWKEGGSRATGLKSYLANISAFCVRDPAERIKYMLELFGIASRARNEPEAIDEQVEYARRKFGDVEACAEAALGPLAHDPDLAYELSHEYAVSLGAVVSGVPTALLVDGGRAKKTADGYVEVEKLFKEYLATYTRKA